MKIKFSLNRGSNILQRDCQEQKVGLAPLFPVRKVFKQLYTK